MQVAEIYNQIASEFSQTRNRSWDDFDLFKKIVQRQLSVAGDQLLVLDVGCGNGRNISLLTKEGGEGGRHYIGIDASEGMIEQARKLHPDCDFRVADMRALPFEDNEFDIVFAIASLNHMLTKDDQRQAIEEMFRVVKPGGYICMTNWNLWRFTWKEKSWWRYVFCRDVPLACLIKQEGNGRQDATGWRLYNPKIVTTYWNHHPLPYYAFTVRELNRMVKQVGGKIEQSFYSKNGQKSHWWSGRNIVVIGQKKV